MGDGTHREHRPLTQAVFQILLALVDRERHGYAIMQDVVDRTDGRVEMGPGTLYGTLKRMLRDGLVEETSRRQDPDLDDERRRYYRLTTEGLAVARSEADRIARLVDDDRTRALLDGRAAT
jgi:DNA-binding PadR family transcriptional regulator